MPCIYSTATGDRIVTVPKMYINKTRYTVRRHRRATTATIQHESELSVQAVGTAEQRHDKTGVCGEPGSLCAECETSL